MKKPVQLARLQRQCDTVNKIFLAGKNDSDQRQTLFNLFNQSTGAAIVIGYDTYNAVSLSDADAMIAKATSNTVKVADGKTYHKLDYQTVVKLNA